jgi:ribose-phosphate pyrophosphokinase
VTLLLILDAVKLENPKSITIVAPYLPYSRQDKKKLNGEVQSAYALCNLLKRAGCDKLVTFDCHFLNAEGGAEFGGLSIENISMGEELVKRAQQHLGNEKFEVVAPDAGAGYLVKNQGGKSFKKVRQEYKDEKIGYREIESLVCDFEVKGKNFVVLDDMISTGNTMIKALEILKQGGAKQVCAAASHGLFLFNCMDKLKKFTDCIISTDSIENEFAKVSIKDKLANIN